VVSKDDALAPPTPPLPVASDARASSAGGIVACGVCTRGERVGSGDGELVLRAPQQLPLVDNDDDDKARATSDAEVDGLAAN
jgi:hypothetical protein